MLCWVAVVVVDDSPAIADPPPVPPAVPPAATRDGENWMSEEAYHDGEFHKPAEVEKALKYTEWICDEDKMKLTNNGLFSHPMPVDRGHEVTDEVASSPRSIIIDVAENRLHVQKAILDLLVRKAL